MAGGEVWRPERWRGGCWPSVREDSRAAGGWIDEASKQAPDAEEANERASCLSACARRTLSISLSGTGVWSSSAWRRNQFPVAAACLPACLGLVQPTPRSLPTRPPNSQTLHPISSSQSPLPLQLRRLEASLPCTRHATPPPRLQACLLDLLRSTGCVPPPVTTNPPPPPHRRCNHVDGQTHTQRSTYLSDSQVGACTGDRSSRNSTQSRGMKPTDRAAMAAGSPRDLKKLSLAS